LEQLGRFSRLYGAVARAQNQEIMSLITGKIVLEVGCGYGYLVWQVERERERGGEELAVGMDLDATVLHLGRTQFGIKAVVGDVYSLSFPNEAFDTVVLRETAHHLDLPAAMPELDRVCRKEIIIFDPNPTLML